jgi:hypothetical protein
MMTWMSMELIGSVDVIWWDFGSEVGQTRADFCQTLTTNPVFEKSSTPKFEVDDVRFLKKFGRLSFKILNF